MKYEDVAVWNGADGRETGTASVVAVPMQGTRMFPLAATQGLPWNRRGLHTILPPQAQQSSAA
jgi:hypothetical protein